MGNNLNRELFFAKMVEFLPKWWIRTPEQIQKKYQDTMNKNLPFEAPMIDLSKLRSWDDFCEDELAKLYKALVSDGFLYVKNHGVPKKVTKELRDITPTFYKSSKEEKRKISPDKEGLYDLQPGRVIEHAGIAFKNTIPLLKLDPSIELNVKKIDAITRDYILAMEKLSSKLTYWFEIALGLEHGSLKNRMVQKETGFTSEALCYDNDPEGLQGHYDGNMVTILMNELDTGGLSARWKDVWHDVPPIKDAFVVNFGNMMEHITSGVITATYHQARNLRPSGMHSWPTFVAPRDNVPLKPISQFHFNKEKYAKVLAANPDKETFPDQTDETYSHFLQKLNDKEVRNDIGGKGGIWEFQIGPGCHAEAVRRSQADARRRKRRKNRNIRDMIHAFESLLYY